MSLSPSCSGPYSWKGTDAGPPGICTSSGWRAVEGWRETEIEKDRVFKYGRRR